MLIIYNYDDIIFERNGENLIAKELSKTILSEIEINIGKLIINKSLSFNCILNNNFGINFNNSIINISLSNRFYGNINTNSCIISNNTISNLVINLELILSPMEISAKRFINNKINQTINHEFLHLIERYLTINDNKKLSNSWSMDGELKKMQNKYKNDKNWQDISYFIYLSLPHEIRARTHQLNSEIEQTGLNGIKNVIKYIKNSKIYKDLDFLSNMDGDILLDKLKKDINYDKIISDFSCIFLKNPSTNYESNFLKYIKSIKNKNKKILDRLINTSYNFENYFIDDKIINYSEFLKK
jgi:hypothetical protein